MVHAESIVGLCRGRINGRFLSNTGRDLWDKLCKCFKCPANSIYMLGKQHMYSARSYCMPCTMMIYQLHIFDICGHNQYTRSCEDTGIACNCSNVIYRVVGHTGKSIKISSTFLAVHRAQRSDTAVSLCSLPGRLPVLRSCRNAG
jgi:hypothetical protein